MFTDILPSSLEAVTVAFVIVVFRMFVNVPCHCSMYIVRLWLWSSYRKDMWNGPVSSDDEQDECVRTWKPTKMMMVIVMMTEPFPQNAVLCIQLNKPEQAALRGDQRSLYLIVRRLSPKHRRFASRLRGEDGHLLCCQEELQHIIAYGNDTFAAQIDDHHN